MPINTNNSNSHNIAFIGFGEAAGAFMAGWKFDQSRNYQAYDIKTDAGNSSRQDKLDDYQRAGIKGNDSASQCVANSDVILSMVTADQALLATKSVESALKENSFYFDCNSCAPDTKRQSASIINNAGGRYVDVAIIAPVYPALHETPVLISGEWAKDAKEAMDALGMSATLIEGDVGTASSIKMIRSVMMKGLEALAAECVLAGRKAGVEEIVLDSLDATYPGFNWKSRSAYMLERMMVHGKRRAAEMSEVALSVDQLGVSNTMSRATTNWQQTIGDLQLDAGDDNYQTRADTILDALAKLENQEK